MADHEDARLDEMVAETKALIDQAKEAAEGLRGVLRDLGCNDSNAVQSVFQSGECPADLREKASSEVDKVHQELAEEENRLQLATGKSGATTPPRGGMSKV
jgi:ribosome recycling factor